MASTDTTTPKPSSVTPIIGDETTRGRGLAQAAAEIRAEHPEWGNQPAFDFAVAADEFFANDKVASDRYNLLSARYVGATGDPPRLPSGPAPEPDDAIFDSIRAECMDLLRERPDLQALWDKGFGDRENWRKLYVLRPESDEKQRKE